MLPAVDFELHALTGAKARDQIAEVAMLGDRNPVHLRDHVATRLDERCLKAGLLAASLQSRLVGGAAVHDLGDERAVTDRDSQVPGELRIERLRADPDEPVVRLAR